MNREDQRKVNRKRKDSARSQYHKSRVKAKEVMQHLATEIAKRKLRAIEMNAQAVLVKATAVKKMTSAIDQANLLAAVKLYNEMGMVAKATAGLKKYEESFTVMNDINELSDEATAAPTDIQEEVYCSSLISASATIHNQEEAGYASMEEEEDIL